ncbi:MAG: hypothetical protein GX376_04530 [Firmicutes bacterium]|nr:hypothetical protein [Bacillota bacterium]
MPKLLAFTPDGIGGYRRAVTIVIIIWPMAKVLGEGDTLWAGGRDTGGFFSLLWL